MAENNAFFSIWAQNVPYWIIVEGMGAASISGMSGIHGRSDLATLNCEANWTASWQNIADQIKKLAPEGAGYRATAVAAGTLPALQEIELSLRPFAEVSAIANNLWLVEDVNEGRLGCYMQKVIDRRGKNVGYEAFARVEAKDGSVIGGGAIMQAATVLRMEYQLDRILHKHAIESFVASDLEGYIFINFLTGFIHRPEVYLEGLSHAANRTHMRPGAIVLDVPLGDDAMDLPKLKTIALYCRSRGFALALDNVMTHEKLEPLLEEVRPAFVKLDGKFGARMNELKRQASLREIVRLSHAIGASVLAEGVETQVLYDSYHEAEVDMFQGYLFGAPESYSRENKPVAKLSGN